MFVSKLPSNKNRGSPESFSLKILEYSYPQCHRHRRLLESDNYRGDQSVTNVPVTERPDQCLCLPNNVLPVTKAAVFTILVIVHLYLNLHLSLCWQCCLQNRSEWDLRGIESIDRCGVLRIFWGISHGTLEIVEETEELEIMWPSLSVFAEFPVNRGIYDDAMWYNFSRKIFKSDKKDQLLFQLKTESYHRMKIIKNYIIRRDKGSSGFVNTTTIEIFRNGKGSSFRIFFSDRPRMVINRQT